MMIVMMLKMMVMMLKGKVMMLMMMVMILIMCLQEDDDLILAVYDYWLNKRLDTQQCLIPLGKSQLASSSTLSISSSEAQCNETPGHTVHC